MGWRRTTKLKSAEHVLINKEIEEEKKSKGTLKVRAWAEVELSAAAVRKSG